MRKLSIAAGLNENATREQKPRVPITPDEIAREPREVAREPREVARVAEVCARFARLPAAGRA